MRVAWLVVVFACGKGGGSSPAIDTTCTSNDDCMISCISRDDCCGSPCPCYDAKHRAVVASIREHNERACEGQDRRNCPMVSCQSPIERVEARCKAGTCVAQVVEIASATLTRGCGSAGECSVVKSAPCERCSCPDTVIVSMYAQRYNELAAGCGSAQPSSCPPCPTIAADCLDHFCVHKQ
jgi:hypothetical protein